MSATHDEKEIPLDLARAGEARHFIAWRGAVAGLGSGGLSDLAVAAEALLTDILLSGEEGKLRMASEHTDELFTMYLYHPRIDQRRMADLGGILEQYLDGHEVSPNRAVLVKRLSR